MRELKIKRISIFAEPSKGFATKVKVKLSFGKEQEEMKVHFCPEGHVNVYYSHFFFYGLNEEETQTLKKNLLEFYEEQNAFGKEKHYVLPTVVIGLEQMFNDFNRLLTDIVAVYVECQSDENGAIKIGNRYFIES